MSLPTDSPSHSGQVGMVDGERSSGEEFAVLDPFVCQSPRWCANCGGEQTFFPVYEFELGRVGFCFGCGEERIAPFTRMNSEAA
jgi:hypothetical protein